MTNPSPVDGCDGEPDSDHWTPRLVALHIRSMWRHRYITRHPELRPEERLLIDIFGVKRAHPNKDRGTTVTLTADEINAIRVIVEPAVNNMHRYDLNNPYLAPAESVLRKLKNR